MCIIQYTVDDWGSRFLSTLVTANFPGSNINSDQRSVIEEMLRKLTSQSSVLPSGSLIFKTDRGGQSRHDAAIL